uniref:Mediator of RNA polymerase II transcription subunit 22 n=1 Tax=Panagrolaimus sp. PS1159 TaxID=55785 RepID=A0AC35FQU2_9BILA
MNRAGPSGGGGGGKSGPPGGNSKIMMSKTQLLSDYRNRLRGALRSAAENIQGLALAAKIPTDDSHKHHSQTARTAHYNTVRNELVNRATLIVKAAEELLTLNNDVKSFTILRDFKSVNEAIIQSESAFKQEVNRGANSYDGMRLVNAGMSTDLDKELADHFQRNY